MQVLRFNGRECWGGGGGGRGERGRRDGEGVRVGGRLVGGSGWAGVWRVLLFRGQQSFGGLEGRERGREGGKGVRDGGREEEGKEGGSEGRREGGREVRSAWCY